MKFLNPIRRGLAVLALFALAHRAGAVTITQTTSVTTSANNYGTGSATAHGGFDYAAFNPALGGLTSATLSATLQVAAFSSEFNPFDFSRTVTTGTSVSAVVHIPPNGVFLPDQYQSGPTVTLAPRGAANLASAYTFTWAQTFTGAADLAGFTGGGKNINASSLVWGFGSYGTTTNTTTFDFSVVYTYGATAAAPANAPDGGATAALLAPVLLLGWLHRRHGFRAA